MKIGIIGAISLSLCGSIVPVRALETASTSQPQTHSIQLDINDLDLPETDENEWEQATFVNQLSDVRPGDWAFRALQSLVERYGCIVGYPDLTYRGDRSLTRYEFAAGLNACLNRVSKLIAAGTANFVRQIDLITLQTLQEEFAAELTTLRGRVEALEVRTATLEKNQFSTTTKLQGQVVLAVNAGSFSGDRIIAPTGATVATVDPNPTVLYRTSVFFNTSFKGTDQLQIRLVAASAGSNDNAAGFLEPNFTSVLDYAVPGRPQFTVGRLFYTFTPIKDVTVTVGPQIVAPDFVDRNSFANASFLDFSTQALVNNFPLFPRPAGGGAFVNWNLGKSPFKLRALYVAGNAASFNTNDDRFIEGPQAPALLFPNRGGRGGLFNDPSQGIVEAEYSPSKAFALRLQYAGGIIFGSRFNVFGANAELAITPQLGIFGRFGRGTYQNTTINDLSPTYWSAGVTLRDGLRPGALAGVGVAQPLIESSVGNATQMNFEAFYNYPVSDNIRVTPLIQVITNAGNQGNNGTIVTGTLRTVFSF